MRPVEGEEAVGLFRLDVLVFAGEIGRHRPLATLDDPTAYHTSKTNQEEREL